MKRPLCLVGTTLSVAAAAAAGVVDRADGPADRSSSSRQAAAVDVPTVPVPPVADESGRRQLSHRPHPSYEQPASFSSASSAGSAAALRGGKPRRREGEREHAGGGVNTANDGNIDNERRLVHATTGTFRNLVLPLRFADHASRTLPSQSDISRLYNSEETHLNSPTFPDGFPGSDADDVVPTGSVRQVYSANSHGTFTIETTVVDWITLEHDEKYYANGNHGFSMFKEAIVEALQQLDSGSLPSLNGVPFDFSEFDLDSNFALDGLGVLHSGYGAEFGGDDCEGQINENRIWSHKGGLEWTSGSSTTEEGDDIRVNRYYVSSALRGKCESYIVRMGVICHELGHYLGLPDLYDGTFDGAGLGAYDFMSQSWGMDGSGLYPPYLSAWSKLKVGWATATTIDSDGTYSVEANTISDSVYKITAGYPEGEYLLIENRQPNGYDSKIEGGGGLAVYHVDEEARQGERGYPLQSGWPQNGNHYKVALLAADGSYDLERGVNQGDSGDLWHSGTYLTELNIGDAQYPNTDRYRDGDVEETGIRIYDFSASGNIMTFKVEGLGQAATPPPTPPPTAPPTPDPTLPPTSEPSRQPTEPPSAKPTSSPSRSPTTSSPTTSSPTSICAKLCLIPLDGREPCPRDAHALPDCANVGPGGLCDADGECGTDQYLNNCGAYDVYRRVNCYGLPGYVAPHSGGSEEAVAASLGDSMSLSLDDVTSEFELSPTRSPTREPTDAIAESKPYTVSVDQVMQTSVDIDQPTTQVLPQASTNAQEDCKYYPGWNLGLSYCLRDCHQPAYMANNPVFEFDGVDGCCELHYQGKDSCKLQSSRHYSQSHEASRTGAVTGSIGGRVWKDVNDNGYQDGNEFSMVNGVGGVRVSLYQCDNSKQANRGRGEYIDVRSTSTDGSYLFDDVPEGRYYASIETPVGYRLTSHRQGFDGVLDGIDGVFDSDFGSETGRTGCQELGVGNYAIKLDAGLVPEPEEETEMVSMVGVAEADDGENRVKAADAFSAGVHSKSGGSTSVLPPVGSGSETQDADEGAKEATAMAPMTAVLPSGNSARDDNGTEDAAAVAPSTAVLPSGNGARDDGGAKAASASSTTLHSKSQLRGGSSATAFASQSPHVTVVPTDDATIQSDPNIKFIGGTGELRVGPQLTWEDNALLRFDLSNLPNGQDYLAAQRATLKLYALTASPSGGVVHLALRDSNVDWDEGTVSWNTAPELGDHVLGMIGPTRPNTWVEVDVTGMLLVQGGVMTLRVTREEANHSWIAKYSSKDSLGGHSPELRVYF